MEKKIVSVKEKYSDIIDYWNLEKNEKNPEEVSYGTHDRFYFNCPVCGGEIYTRPRNFYIRFQDGGGCRKCAGKRIWEKLKEKGYSQAEENHRRWLKGVYNKTSKTKHENYVKKVNFAKDHKNLLPYFMDEMNRGMNPDEYPSSSKEKAWWKCPKCGELFNETFLAMSRNGCCPECRTGFSKPSKVIYRSLLPFFTNVMCNTRKILRNKMELDIYIPEIKTAIEYDGVYYHSDEKTRDRDTLKNEICKEKGIRLLRIREHDLEEMSDCECFLIDHRKMVELKDSVNWILKKLGLEYEYSNEEIRDILDIVKLERDSGYQKVNKKKLSEWCEENNRNDIVGLWDFEKNEKGPDKYPFGSHAIVWWKCDRCGNSWEKQINDMRTKDGDKFKGNGCPYCSGNKPIVGKTDFGSVRPEIYKWITKESEKQPEDVSYGSKKVLKLKCPECGEKFYESPHKLHIKEENKWCPKCSGKRENIKRRKKIRCVETGEVFSSITEAEMKFGRSGGSISLALKNKTETGYGYHWEFVEEES